MDYAAVAKIAEEHSHQVLNSMKIPAQIQAEVASQVESIIAIKIEEQFSDIRQNIDVLNKQIKLLKEIVERVHDKVNQ